MKSFDYPLLQLNEFEQVKVDGLIVSLCSYRKNIEMYQQLAADGMVVDFAHVKRMIQEKLDHKNLNEVLSFNPTAENIAKWICNQIPQCFKVMVQESENNIAWYEKDK